MDERQTDRRFYAVNHEDDEVITIDSGSLIPDKKFSYTPKRIATVPVVDPVTNQKFWVVVMLSSLLLFTLSFGAIKSISQAGPMLASLASFETVPAPVIVIEHPYTNAKRELQYGVQLSFSEPYFFTEVREGLIDSGESFLEVHTADKQVRYFKNGVLEKQISIIEVADRGTWGEPVPGLYRVSEINKKQFSNLGQVYLPWQIAFGGNISIHGQPELLAESAQSEHKNGSISLADADAKYLFENIKKGLPVIVYNKAKTEDSFTYEPTVPDVEAPHYLIADIGNNTVLASSDRNIAVSIASLTKLMTALVATEQINLDEKITVEETSLVHSLVPRLQDQGKVSLYSLLQLLLLESSNEASEVIASHLGREKFINLMNDRAATLGLANTTFADPSGLSADNKSSLNDLLRLTEHIFTTRSFLFNLSAERDLKELGDLINFNPIEADDSFVGGKIGETIAAGQTSISLHQLSFDGQDRILVVIVLGSESREADVTYLLQYVKDRFGGVVEVTGESEIKEETKQE